MHNGGERNANTRYTAGLRVLLSALIGLTVLRLAVLIASPLDLFVDEAQYWLWSTRPSFGYYSKPPFIAWLIAFTTALVGDAEWGVRLASPLLHAGTAGFVFLAGRSLYDARTGVAAAVVYLTLPAVSFSSLLISTDVPLLFFWSAALFSLIQARQHGGGWWGGLGLSLGLGLLSKYAMAFFLIGWLWGELSSPRASRRGALVALAIAGSLYAPNLVWNAAHGFISYQHTSENADLAGAHMNAGELLAFMASQIAMVGPGVFLGLMAALISRPLRDEPARWLIGFIAPVLVFYLALALVAGANANWAVSAYVAGSILAARGLMRASWRPAWGMAVGLNVLLGLAIAGAVLCWGEETDRFPLRADPLKRLRGWETLGAEVSQWRQRYPADCVLVTDRATASAMAYYALPRPAPVVKWHPPGPIRDHFDLTADLADVACPAWLLVAPPDRATGMARRFTGSEALGTVGQPQGDRRERRYAIYRLHEFAGYPTRSPSP